MMQDEEARIDALVRSVQQKRGDQEVTVSDEAVHAYLTGRATAAQKSEVRRALLGSATFRQELLELAAQLGELTTDAALARFEAAPAPPTPVDLVQRIHSATSKVGQRPPQKRLGAALENWFAPIRAFLEQAFRLRVLVPVGAAVSLAISIVPRVVWSPIMAPTLTTAMDPRSFASPPTLPRGDFEDHEEAARMALRRCVRLREARLTFEPPASGAAPAAGNQRIEVKLTGEWRRKLRIVELQLGIVPAASGSGETRAIVWLALLSSESAKGVELRSYPLTGNSVAVRWPAEIADRGVLLATYEREGRIEASAPVFVDLASN